MVSARWAYSIAVPIEVRLRKSMPSESRMNAFRPVRFRMRLSDDCLIPSYKSVPMRKGIFSPASAVERVGFPRKIPDRLRPAVFFELKIVFRQIADDSA